MDDAVYAYKYKNGGYRVYVSISDVSHYVKIGSELFKRAYEKGNSCYINNTVFHMLHQIISNGICSLNPEEDRLTKTVIMDIDSKGNIITVYTKAISKDENTLIVSYFSGYSDNEDLNVAFKTTFDSLTLK